MRLTLRTMLAYMDDILDPEDAEALGKKIEESEFATGVLHRTRDCMRRLRLGAPKVMEQGAGLDPNTVSEYLDNTLSDDRVADFEKVCLESDVHLAEVASCHQILTLVLGEPAEVTPESRLRMYRLAELAAPPAADDGSGVSPAAPPVQADAGHGGPPPVPAPWIAREVPDYLRAASTTRRLFWPVAGAVIVLLLVAIVVMLIAGRPGPAKRPLAKGPESKGPSQPDASQADLAPAVPSAAEPAADGAPAADTPPEDASRKVLPPPVPPDEPWASSSGGRAGEPPSEEPAEQPAEPAEQPAEPAVLPPPETLASNPLRPPSEVVPGEPVEETTPAPPTEPAPLPPEEVGQLVSSAQILLKLDTDTGAWRRLPDQQALMSDELLLSLPTYRPAIVLSDQIKLVLIDEARVRLLACDQEGIHGVNVDYGRLVIKTAAGAGSRLRLQLGERAGVVTFADAESALAVEVRRESASTQDPETQPGPLKVDLYAHTGRILWQEGAGREPVAVSAPLRLTLNDQPLEAVAVAEFPDWLLTDTISPLDRRASGTVAEAVSVGRPVELTLGELVEHRQKEVRQLALRCLAAIGDFELLVKALDDPDERMLSQDYFYIDQLRAAVRRSPQAAAQVRTTMEQLYGGSGVNLYEMLWKYGPEELGADEAAELVDYLEDDTLAFRRLSFWNLREITGMGLYYRPEDTAAERRSSVRKWRERLNNMPVLKSTPPKQESPPSQEADAAAVQKDPGTDF